MRVRDFMKPQLFFAIRGHEMHNFDYMLNFTFWKDLVGMPDALTD